MSDGEAIFYNLYFLQILKIDGFLQDCLGGLTTRVSYLFTTISPVAAFMEPSAYYNSPAMSLRFNYPLI
jgi:hypothetical protein